MNPDLDLLLDFEVRLARLPQSERIELRRIVLITIPAVLSARVARA